MCRLNCTKTLKRHTACAGYQPCGLKGAVAREKTRARRDAAVGHGRVGLDLRRRERRGRSATASSPSSPFGSPSVRPCSPLWRSGSSTSVRSSSAQASASCWRLGYYCQTLGLRYTTVTNSGFITSLFVVTTPIINRLLFGVKIRPIFWLAVAISLAGLYLLTSAGSPHDGSQQNRSAGVPPAMEKASGDVPLLRRSSAEGESLPGTACKQAVAHDTAPRSGAERHRRSAHLGGGDLLRPAHRPAGSPCKEPSAADVGIRADRVERDAVLSASGR